jgi:hypothetical protein
MRQESFIYSAFLRFHLGVSFFCIKHINANGFSIEVLHIQVNGACICEPFDR